MSYFENLFLSRNCIITLLTEKLIISFSLLIIVSHYSIFKVHKHFNVECGVRSAEFFIPYSSFCILHSNVVGLSGLEPPTSRLSGVRSNRLSYKPVWFSWCISSHSHCGGDEEDRTPDLLLARQALSQLSYTPIGIFFSRYQTLKIK